jgi:hypothetical protein
MTGIIIKAIVGLFIWLMLPQIISKRRKLKKNTKTFFKIVCFIVGIAVIAFAGIDLVKLLLNFN